MDPARTATGSSRIGYGGNTPDNVHQTVFKSSREILPHLLKASLLSAVSVGNVGGTEAAAEPTDSQTRMENGPAAEPTWMYLRRFPKETADSSDLAAWYLV